MKIRTYSEVITLKTFEERFRYLKLDGMVGSSTFGSARYLNQEFYRSLEWKRLRDQIIIRDGGNDLACDDHMIRGVVHIHHLNPITLDDIRNASSKLFDPENLICVSTLTHQAIHYSDEELLPKDYVPRTPFDTCPWKQCSK